MHLSIRAVYTDRVEPRGRCIKNGKKQKARPKGCTEEKGGFC